MTKEASRIEHLANICALKSHEQELFEKGRPPEHRLGILRVENGNHEAQDVKSKSAVTLAKSELSNLKKPQLGSRVRHL